MMTPGGVTPAPLRSAQLTVYLAVSYTHAGIAGHSKTERNDTEIGESLKTVSFGVIRYQRASPGIASHNQHYAKELRELMNAFVQCDLATVR